MNAVPSPLLPLLLSMALFVIALFAVRALFVWWRRKRYTRERFAFWGFAALVGLVGLFLMQLSLGISPATIAMALVSLFAESLGLESAKAYTSKPLTPLTAVLSALVLFGLGLLYWRIHRNWDGAISRRQHERDERRERREPPSILADVVFRVRAFPDPKLLLPYGSTPDVPQPPLEGAADTRAWHEKARHLWLLRQRNHEFDSHSRKHIDYATSRRLFPSRVGARVCLHRRRQGQSGRGRADAALVGIRDIRSGRAAGHRPFDCR